VTERSIGDANATGGAAGGRSAPVNGLQMYYEVHGPEPGARPPLVLLHGGLDTIDTAFGQVLPLLAATRRVIAVELQGHGRTADVDRPLTYEAMADDVAALLRHLGLEAVDLFGFSLGGGVALQTVFRHPERVRKLVVASAPYKRDGWFPEVLAGIAALTADEMVGTPWHDAYLRVAPAPGDWPRLVARVSAFLSGTDYDWTEEVRAIRAPVLIVVGDADSVRPSHALAMFELLGGGQADGGTSGLPNAQLAVLPGTTHLDVLARPDRLLPAVVPFLDAPRP
jgi:pimeloyl-ACP methyl ester carboxylesterase